MLWECRAATTSRQAFGTRHGISGNVFRKSSRSSSAPYPQELNPWSSNITEHTSPHVMSESQTQIFEVFDAKIASPLNRIIQNTRFKKRIRGRPKKRTTSFRGRQIALIYECFRVNGTNDSVENYAELFTVVLRNDDIQEFDSKWNGILLSMTKVPCDLGMIVQIKKTRV